MAASISSYRRAAELALALLLATASGAHAAPPRDPRAVHDAGAVKPLRPCHSAAGCDRRDHDYSGTRGRMGLGADPAHPEGPGNAPN